MSDVDFKNQRVRFPHNEWPLLKRSWHEGEVPLWPRLAQILEDYIERWQPTDLLFPSHITGRVYTNINDALRTYGHLQDDRQRLAVVEYREADVTELKRANGDA